MIFRCVNSASKLLSCSADLFTRFERSQNGVAEQLSLLGYNDMPTAIGTIIEISEDLSALIFRV
jgi:hypothetical protein